MKTLSFETVECLKQQVATSALVGYCKKNGYTIVKGYEKAQPMHVRVRMTSSSMRLSINCYAILGDKQGKQYIIVFDMFEGRIAQFDFAEFDETTTRQLSRKEFMAREDRNEYGPLFTEFHIADVPVVRKYDADGWMYHAAVTKKKSK